MVTALYPPSIRDRIGGRPKAVIINSMLNGGPLPAYAGQACRVSVRNKLWHVLSDRSF